MAFTFLGLNKASFRNVEFLYESGTTTGGRKTVVHEFVNKDTRFVEDVGKNLRTFSIIGVIHGAFYQTRKKELEAALADKATIGILVHPLLTENVNCKCTGYSLPEDNADLGIARYEMTFLEAQPNIQPSTTGRNKALINRIYDAIYKFAEDFLKAEAIIDFVKNINYIAQRLDSLIDVFNDIDKTIISDADDKDTYHESATTFKQNTYRIASDPDRLGADTTDLFKKFDTLAQTGEVGFYANSQLFDPLIDNDTISNKTIELQQRNTDRGVLNGAINTLAINNMSRAAINIEYKNTLQLDDIIDKLDKAYNDLLNNPNNILSEELSQILETQRNELRKYFNVLRIIIPKVITIQTAPMPVTILTYQYYGATDNYGDIIDLNQIYNPSLIDGEVQILSV